MGCCTLLIHVLRLRLRSRSILRFRLWFYNVRCAYRRRIAYFNWSFRFRYRFRLFRCFHKHVSIPTILPFVFACFNHIRTWILRWTDEFHWFPAFGSSDSNRVTRIQLFAFLCSSVVILLRSCTFCKRKTRGSTFSSVFIS